MCGHAPGRRFDPDPVIGAISDLPTLYVVGRRRRSEPQAEEPPERGRRASGGRVLEQGTRPLLCRLVGGAGRRGREAVDVVGSGQRVGATDRLGNIVQPDSGHYVVVVSCPLSHDVSYLHGPPPQPIEDRAQVLTRTSVLMTYREVHSRTRESRWPRSPADPRAPGWRCQRSRRTLPAGTPRPGGGRSESA